MHRQRQDTDGACVARALGTGGGDSAVPSKRGSRWNTARLVLFRFSLLYFVLYALPFPFRHLLMDVRSAGAMLHEWFGSAEPAWTATTLSWFGEYDAFWKAVTTWLSTHDWVGLEVIHQPTGAGDTAHAYVKLLVSGILALVLAVVWSWFARRKTTHERLGRWFHLGVRWYLFFSILGYGLIKLYASQFGYPSLGTLLRPLGDNSPMGLVWTFMGFSKPYEVISGLGEAIGASLLLWHRTALLGCFVLIPVMGNVVLLNFLYGVPVKLFSGHLLLFTIALLVPFVPRLLALFVTNRTLPPPVDLRVVRNRWVGGCLVAFGFLWISIHLWSAHEGYMAFRERRVQAEPELYGVWEVERMVRDGKHIGVSDMTRWKHFVVEHDSRAWFETTIGKRSNLDFSYDLERGECSMAPMSRKAPSKPASVSANDSEKQRSDTADASSAPWSLERRRETRKAQDRYAKTMAERVKFTDQPRDVLVLRGTWEDEPLELTLVRKVFNLEREFRWVQELPR
ncbi:MAG: hypothetical protein H6832_18445 [Planctomycetes bacterium]|nr:hypothetical protein [Planctomycetota bacterium]MCB9920388.1 hypothetical protein [Planctomycetota bacterium]